MKFPHLKIMASDGSITTQVKEGTSVLGEVIKIAGNNPDAKQAANNLGKAARIITETINNGLLPLAAINYAFGKAQKYFQENFEKELSDKTISIPPEHITQPKASIAGPILQGLAFTHEEVNLKEMYLNLLATAMDNRISEVAHPAFTEIIKQLNSEEAQMFKEFSESLPICLIKLTHTEKQSWNVLAMHLLNDIDLETENPIVNPKVPALVDNLIRLGLIKVDYQIYLSDTGSYEWVDQRPEVVALKTQFEDEIHKIEIERGTLERTAFGIQFAKAIGL